MHQKSCNLTVDEAVAAFSHIVCEELGESTAGPRAPETPEEAETRLFRFAECVLRMACPEPTRCIDPRCRRLGLCRHFADLRARQQAPPSGQSTRRSPGASATRHAIWVYMNTPGT